MQPAKVNARNAIILLSWSIAAFGPGCLETTDPLEEFFVVKVDSVQAAGTITLGDTLTIRLWGFVGPDACYSVSHFESFQQAAGIDFTVWGRHAREKACATVIVEMRGTKYPVVPRAQGPFTIAIHQPDGSTLKDTVLVQ